MRVLSGDVVHEGNRQGTSSIGSRDHRISSVERRQLLARELQERREDEVLDLHTRRDGHYIDNAFSLVTANMAVVSLVLGCVYITRTCEKPLAGFLLVLSFLAPFAACLPVLLRQWFYLHLRLKNIVTVLMLTASVFYVVWLLVGQRWAFASSAQTCDQDLSTAANVVIFILYLMLLMYAAKVVWYLLVRVRYSYKQLIVSCFRDPYPNALAMTDLELDQLDAALVEPPADELKIIPQKNPTLLALQRYQHGLRQSLHRISLSHPSHDPPCLDKVDPPPSKPKNWVLDFTKPRRKSSRRSRTATRASSVVPAATATPKSIFHTEDPNGLVAD